MDFNTLYQELQNSTEMIRALLFGIAQEDARIKPNRESWSMLEVICHLYDEEREDFREHLDFILHRQTGPSAREKCFRAGSHMTIYMSANSSN